MRVSQGARRQQMNMLLFPNPWQPPPTVPSRLRGFGESVVNEMMIFAPVAHCSQVSGIPEGRRVWKGTWWRSRSASCGRGLAGLDVEDGVAESTPRRKRGGAKTLPRAF
jgi:hypothetical protein